MKLTQSTKDAILTMKAQGFSSRHIGRVLGTGKSTVNDFLAAHRNIGREVLEGVKYVTEQKAKPVARILIIDIETAPFLAYTFRRWKAMIGQENVEKEGYVLCYAAKWHGDDNIIFSRVQEPENDYEIVKEMKTLIDQADIVVAHNCVEENTPVLKADLTWVRAGDLVEGDKIVGFEEKLAPNEPLRDKNRKWKKTGSGMRKVKESVVTYNKVEPRECFEVRLSNGDKVITTGDHFWLAKTKIADDANWKSTLQLKVGDRLTKYINPLEQEADYDTGWIAGFLAGEGSYSRGRIEFCQRPTSTWEQALRILKEKGVAVSEGRNAKTGGIGRQDTLYATLNLGKWRTLEFLSKTRVNRFIEKIDWDNFGTLRGVGLEEVHVVEVVPVGVKNVAVMSTSTKTFIANGYAMHNCDKFDLPTIKTRMLFHGMTPLAPHKTVDTLKIAKQQFRFPSNSLESIAAYLGLAEQKMKHSGFGLWKRVMQMDEEAWNEMEEYNIQDILVLEKVYEKLRSWDKFAPNMALYKESIVPRCVVCASDKLEKLDKLSHTALSSFHTMRCKCCGKVMRTRHNVRSKEEMQATLTNVM